MPALARDDESVARATQPNRRGWHSLVLALLLAAGAATAQSAPPIEALDAYLDSARADAGLPGLAVVVVQDTGIVFLKGYGTAGADGRPVTPQTPFVLGSVSKSFTALAVTQLIEAGRLELDTPVVDLLPWFRTADPEASARITVRHLLGHTSGLPQRASYIGESEGRTLEERIRELHRAELTAVPGETFQYANINYALLGLLVETLSGQSYAETVRERIFAPLDMHNSLAYHDPDGPTPRADGYRLWFGRPVAADIDYPIDNVPSGYLLASAEDLAHYLIAQLNGGVYRGNRVLSADGTAALHTPTETDFYARGWINGHVEGVPAVFHGGSVANFDAFVALLPERRLGLAVLTNMNSFVAGGAVRRVAEGAVPVLDGRPAPPPRRFSLRTLYLFINAAAGLWVLVMLRGAGRTVTLLRNPERRLSDTSDARKLRRTAIFDMASACAVLTAVPWLTGVSWLGIRTSQPDLTWLLWFSLGLSFVLGLAKLAATRRDAARPEAPPAA